VGPKWARTEEEPDVRIATYTRISTDEVNQPYSLGAQSERLASYVASQEDWELIATFTDQMSGAKLERPGLQGALRAARAGRFDLLLVYRVDRLARSVRGMAEVLEILDAAGVGFRSATEPFDTTSPAGRMMVQMLGVFAEFERATIIDRVIAGMERKSSQGGWCGGTQPFGYRAVKGEGRLEVDEDEAPLIPVIFDLYANKRLGSQAIANQLSASGLTTRSGRPWQFKSILTVLRNRTYLGQVNFRGVWTDGDHPPLVEQGLFDTAQAILAERGEDVAKRASNSSDYLLTGLVVCGNCGSHFTGTRATGRNATYRYYTCGGRQRYGTKSCATDRLPAEALDEAVVHSLLRAYEDTDLFAKAISEAQQRAELDESPQDAERAALQAELDKVERGIDRYLQAFESGHHARGSLWRKGEGPGRERHGAPGPHVRTRPGNHRGRAGRPNDGRTGRPSSAGGGGRGRRIECPGQVTAPGTHPRDPGGQPTGHPPGLPCSRWRGSPAGRCGSRTVLVGGGYRTRTNDLLVVSQRGLNGVLTRE
jgi:site-specific DNA recombinase